MPLKHQYTISNQKEFEPIEAELNEKGLRFKVSGFVFWWQKMDDFKN